jgi:uncharacterized membrane protein
MPVYTFTTLDDPLGTGGTGASGINTAGQIIGGYSDGSNPEHGFRRRPRPRAAVHNSR